MTKTIYYCYGLDYDETFRDDRAYQSQDLAAMRRLELQSDEEYPEGVQWRIATMELIDD